MFQGNLLGLLMLVFSAIFVAFGALILKQPDWIVMSAGGLILFVTDIIFRSLQKSNNNRLMAKNLGGYLFFIPVWIFGLVMIVINIISNFAKN